MSKTFIRHNPKEIKKCLHGIIVFKTPEGQENWTVARYNDVNGFWVAEDDGNYTGCTVTDVYLYEEEPQVPVSSGNDPFAEVFLPIEGI